MYNRLFVKLFKFLEEKKNHDSVFNAVTMLFIIQVIHLTFILSVLEFIGFEIRSFLSFNHSKYLLFPIGGLWIYLLFKFYKKKSNGLFEAHKMLKSISIMELILFVIIPLLIVIYLSSHPMLTL